MNLIDTMILFDKPLEEFEWYCRTRRLKDNTGCIRLTGVSGIEKQHIIGSVSEDYDVNVIVLENDSKVAHFVEDYKFFNPDVVIYPSKDLIFYQADINGKQMLSERMCLLKKLILGEKVTFVTTPDALMTPMIPIEVYKDNCISVEVNGIAEENALAHKLVRMGYVKTAQVSDKGEFSVRGGIVDIFDLTCDNPIRIELWGDTIESIRFFDVSSQRSIETLDKIDIMPATEMILTTSQKESGYHEMSLDAQTLIKSFRESGKPEYASRTENLINDLKVNLLETDMGLNLESFIFYFYQNTNTLLEVIDKRNSCIYIDEPKHVLEHAGAVEYEFRESMSSRLEKGYILPGQASILRPVEEMAAAIQRRRFVAFAGLAESGGVFSYDKDYAVSSRNLMSYNGSFSQLVSDLKKMKKNGNRIVIVSPSRTRAKRLADDLTQEGVVASYTENENKILQKGEIYTFYGRLSTGFEYPEIGFTVISEADIFGSDKHKKKRKPKYGGGRKISGYDELKAGDYVIHVDHGLGIYRGIEKVEVEHVIKDYMKIEYKDGGSLFVLASNFDSVQFYAGKDAKQPKLNKLGTQEWNKTKAKVEKAVGEVAKDLVRLYAVRQEKIGYKYGPDTVWQKEFEELFPFDETMDQLEAIASTKDDMESTRVMDRLICGDVGFGKTEVAIRAAFKAVQEGKQVAYLVPTTILAQQHYNTFVERMSQYPIKVRMLSRFCTTKEIKKTLDELKKGLVDIVIGTHRILSKDVQFSDLGLLIIDEEQRFGVTHKEKIKQMRENVDVLTLTATPIPRTLHMSLIGIRDMSLLEEPPLDRMPIQTYVCEYNEEMVREAVVRELARNGQVYYVYNRVNDIERVAQEVAALIPEARVSYAHGQMNESELEVIMMEFVNHEIDVLVSTTIIETGLDIPNVNTMIIHDSDSLGLSQLYQLRGRVGRSNRSSYAFLMYRRDKLLKEVAEKRLTAIKEFTELGSGYKIAMRDLEIRGAGNILGKAQHGHMMSVGYDLYCKMLEDAVLTERGEKVNKSETTLDVDVDAYIPSEYIVNESQKLDMYKRISCIENEDDIGEMRDEMKDRFGSVPYQAEYLLRIARIKYMASANHITDLKGRGGRIRCTMEQNAPVILEKLPYFINEYGGRLRLKTTGIPEFLLKYEQTGLAERDAEILLDEAEQLMKMMRMLYE